MENYFDSILLYRWKMSDEQVSIFDKKLKKLEWVKMLIIQIILMIIFDYFSYKSLSLLPNSLSSASLPYLLTYSVIFGLLSFVGGYYFTKAFFDTKLSLAQFYTLLTYLYLPIIVMEAIVKILSVLLNNIFLINILLQVILYIVIIFYSLKGLITSLYLFKKKLNTTEWKIIGVVILWGIITSLISALIIPIFF